MLWACAVLYLLAAGANHFGWLGRLMAKLVWV